MIGATGLRRIQVRHEMTTLQERSRYWALSEAIHRRWCSVYCTFVEPGVPLQWCGGLGQSELDRARARPLKSRCLKVSAS